MAVFTSGLTFKNFLKLAGEGGREALESMTIAAIGPVSAQVIENEGFVVNIMPEEATIEALEDAILNWASARKEER